MHKFLFYTGIIAMIGAALVGIGEFFLLYSPDGGHGFENGYQNFMHPTVDQLILGFYLSVFSAPIYILGYWHVTRMLRIHHTNERWIVMGLATFGFMSGLVWLATNAYQGILVQMIESSVTEETGIALMSALVNIDEMSLPLLTVIRWTIVFISGVMAFFILFRDTHYPKFMAVFNPLFLILAVFASVVLVPPVGKVLVPAALNVAHTIFFGLSSYFAYQVWKRNA